MKKSLYSIVVNLREKILEKFHTFIPLMDKKSWKSFLSMEVGDVWENIK